tara:strand:+ start:13907 stop:14155 length:249 start_codon:yes stop_codon:yes gene_type:complete
MDYYLKGFGVFYGWFTGAVDRFFMFFSEGYDVEYHNRRLNKSKYLLLKKSIGYLKLRLLLFQSSKKINKQQRRMRKAKIFIL